MLDIKDFTIVDHAPSGTVVWNIGSHMPDGYVPFVYADRDYHLIPGRPKYAVKLDNAREIMDRSIRGVETMTKTARTSIEKRNK